jgi:hypothetical protein
MFGVMLMATTSGGENCRHRGWPIRNKPMLRKLSDEIADCCRHAEDCRHKADAAVIPTAKEEFVEMERRWLFLARSYEFTERLADFTDYSETRAAKP